MLTVKGKGCGDAKLVRAQNMETDRELRQSNGSYRSQR